MSDADIQTSFAGGELSPQLYARVDLDKFQVGAALLRNFFVDYRGGVSNRAGTEFIDQVTDGSRLIKFVVSTAAAYVLVFSNELITVYNQGVLVTTVVTPYLTADLFQIAYTQSADVLTLVHPNYPPADLERTSDISFTYTPLTTGPDIGPPTITTMTAPHSGPYSFGYLVTAIDLDGKEESLPSNPGVKHSEAMNETTNRVIGLTWTAPPQGVSKYNVYKWGPIDSVTMNPATVWGFIGSSQTTTFSDNNIAPDFSKQPPGWGDPFSGGQFASIVVAGGGAGYDGVSGDWPTAVPYVPLTITGDGTGAAGYAVIDHALGTIIGVFLTNPGKNYTHATVTAIGQGGTGATFTVTFTDIAPLNPGAIAYLQQRRVFGGSLDKPETFVMSEPGLFNNFNTTPVTLATDAVVESIAAEEVNTIKSFVQVNYGLLAFTTGGSFLISGGTPGAVVDAETVSVQAQVSQGANNLRPLKINYDVLYGQAKGNRIHNLAFAWQKQSYAGTDVSTLAAHLFDTFLTADWDYAEEPFKIVWAVRNDGRLLSLTYVPDQDVQAWCRHDTQGLFKSVVTVPEGNVDAVYFLVQRYIPENNPDPTNPAGNWFTYLERMADRQGCCIFDAWFLDCALGLDKPAPAGALFLDGTTGTVTATSVLGVSGAIPDTSGILEFGTTVKGGALVDAQTCIDWSTGRAFLWGTSAQSYDFVNNVSVATAATPGFNGWISRAGEPGDPHFYPSKPGTNCAILCKVDETTLGVISTFGVASSNMPTDATHWAFPADYDLFSSPLGNFLISFSFNSSQTNHEVAVLNVDTMSWTGFSFHADELNGVVCRGLPRGNIAQAFCLANNSPGYQLGVYTILAQTGLCTMTKTATINANEIGHGWTHCSSLSGICLDETDGNIIAMLTESALSGWAIGTNYGINNLVSRGGHDYNSIATPNTGHDPATSPGFWLDLGVSGPVESRLVKFNTSTGHVMWSIAAGVFTGISNWSDTKIKNGTLCYLDPTNLNFGLSRLFHIINTLTGTETTITVNRETNPGNMQSYNDTTGVILFAGTFDITGGAAPPAPIGTTPTSFTNALASFGPAAAPTPRGPFTQTGVIQIGCGKIDITTLISSTEASGTVIDALDIEIPDDPTGAIIPINAGDWTFTTPVAVLSGLDHLEGKQVAALADGVVVTGLTVADGAVTLPTPATNIVVGLQYTSQIQTLYLTTDGIQQGSDQGKRKLISGVTLRVDCTANVWAGTDFGQYLTQVPETMNALDGTLYTGDARVLSYPQWDERGFTCIQQFDPLPVSILGVIVEVTPGDTGS